MHGFDPIILFEDPLLLNLFLAYRFQIAGYRDVHEYRDVKRKEPVSYLTQRCFLTMDSNLYAYRCLIALLL